MRLPYLRPCIAVMGLAFLLVPSSAKAQFSAGPKIKHEIRRLVLAVGINDFQYALPHRKGGDEGWASLQFASKDAHDMVSNLAPYGFEPFRGQVLTGTTATWFNIQNQLNLLLEETQRQPENIYEIVIYFSSHGFSLHGPDGERSYLVTYNTPPRKQFLRKGGPQMDGPQMDAWERAGRFAIDRERILQDFIELLDEHVRHVAVVYDACYVANGKGPRTRTKGQPIFSAQQYRAQLRQQRSLTWARHSTLVFSSVSMGQVAIEDETLAGSRYTHFLTEALRQGPGGPADELIPSFPFSLFEAHQWATIQVRNISGNTQVPSWGGPRVNEGAGFFYLEPAPQEPQNQAAVLVQEPRPLSARIFVLLNGAKGATQEIEIPPSGLTVPHPGTYEVRVRDADDGTLAMEMNFAASAGQVVTLDVGRALEERQDHLFYIGSGYLSGSGLWGQVDSVAPNGPFAALRYGLDGWPAPDWVAGVGLEAGRNQGQLQAPETLGGVQTPFDQTYIAASLDLDRLTDVKRIRLGIGGSLLFGSQWLRFQDSETYFLPGIEARLSAQFGLTRGLTLDIRNFTRIQGYGPRFNNGAIIFGASRGLTNRLARAFTVHDP